MSFDRASSVCLRIEVSNLEIEFRKVRNLSDEVDSRGIG